ncbi:MAG: hypothetical protein KF832_30625, partial [Caldilineaceae bacterium]|nr:hypothetical protein [Caldilineaceae bacterium]
MLTPPDAALVAREVHLPGLGHLLDPAACLALIQAAQPTPMQCLKPVYVRYKPATSCLVAYAVRSVTTTVPTYCYGVAFRHDEVDKLAKAQTKRYATSPLGWDALVDEQHALVFYGFPNDRRLKALRCLQDAGKRTRLLTNLTVDPTVAHGQLVPLRYKPERRLVACVQGATRQRLLRFYAEDEFTVAAANHQAIQPTAYFDTPHLIGLDEANQVLLLTWLAGEPFERYLVAARADEGEAACRWVGRALAAFHAQSVPLANHYTSAGEGE